MSAHFKPTNMDAFDKKTLKTSRGFTYTYYTADGDKSLPTLFFQHGWPDNAEMWKDVAGPLRSTKHPIIIPDLLGYDGTDKPTDPAAYKWDVMLKDLIEICDKEGASKIVSLGHDWGSACASRLYNYYPDRVVGLVNFNVGYMTPQREPFDLDAYNAIMEQAFGYPAFEYWHLFTADDGPEVLKKDVGRLFDALHGTGETNMKDFFCKKDGIRNFLTNGGPEITVRPYAQAPGFKQKFVDRFNRDGFEGPQCWYKGMRFNHFYECDKQLPEGADKVNVPTLYIGGKEDAVCRPEAIIPAIQAGLLPHLEQKELLPAAHWTPFEVPQQMVELVEPWLKKNFGQ